MTPGERPPLTPESHPELAAALKDAGLWYAGDKQDGFIKGWQAHQRAGEGEDRKIQSFDHGGKIDRVIETAEARLHEERQRQGNRGMRSITIINAELDQCVEARAALDAARQPKGEQ